MSENFDKKRAMFQTLITFEDYLIAKKTLEREELYFIVEMALTFELLILSYLQLLKALQTNMFANFNSILFEKQIQFEINHLNKFKNVLDYFYFNGVLDFTLFHYFLFLQVRHLATHSTRAPVA